MAERMAITVAVPVMSTTVMSTKIIMQHFAKGLLPACRLVVRHLCQDRGCEPERSGRAGGLFGRPCYSLMRGA